jgi:hypothetical protein
MATVTPQGGLSYQVATGGVAVIAIPPGVSGGFIINPSSATDQGFSSAASPENLIVDPVNPPSLIGNNTSTALVPGQSFSAIPYSTKPLMVNAPTSGHKFTVVYWL